MSVIESIAYVEDSDHDALMLETAVNRENLADEVVRLNSVASAEHFVERLAAAKTTVPSLVFVDVDLPDGSGHSVVASLRRKFDESVLPVIVFSGSDDAGDIGRAYDVGANCYVIKPLTFGEYCRRVGGVCRFVAAVSATMPRPHSRTR